MPEAQTSVSAREQERDEALSSERASGSGHQEGLESSRKRGSQEKVLRKEKSHADVRDREDVRDRDQCWQDESWGQGYRDQQVRVLPELIYDDCSYNASVQTGCRWIR